MPIRRPADAQALLNDRFQAYIDGTGPEPTDEDRDRVSTLRTLAHAKLEVAMSYVKTNARGPASGKSS